MDWARILAYITGTVDQELLSRNEYLVTENRILKRQLKGRLLLSDAERATLGEIGHRLGRKALADVANAAKQITKEVTWLMAIDDDLAEGFLQHNQLTRKFGTHNTQEHEQQSDKPNNRPPHQNQGRVTPINPPHGPGTAPAV